MEVLLPTVEGEEPPARCRHVAVRIPMSVLGCREVAALKGNLSKEDFDSGAIIALHGGYMGRQTFGGSELLLLWVSADGSRVRWSSVETFGWHPPPCFHHTVVALRRSPVLILLGGETSSQHLPAGFIYALWLHTMTWEKMPTSGTPHEVLPHITLYKPSMSVFLLAPCAPTLLGFLTFSRLLPLCAFLSSHAMHSPTTPALADLPCTQLWLVPFSLVIPGTGEMPTFLPTLLPFPHPALTCLMLPSPSHRSSSLPSLFIVICFS